MLTLKPGLFTHQGSDWAGDTWLAPLTHDASVFRPHASAAHRVTAAPPDPAPASLVTHANTSLHPSNTHKGQFGDVGVMGGESGSVHGQGMEGAAMLAASAALHSGAGRVMLHLLGSRPQSPRPGGVAPDIMLRSLEDMATVRGALVCGCGGGRLVHSVLPGVLTHTGPLVLDADALNAIATDTTLRPMLRARTCTTVLTPHPLELARLLQTSTAAIQSDRIHAALQAARQLNSIVVLKGSGTVTASPQGHYAINHSGNARLAIGGTGDVLAGCLGAQLAALPTDAPWQSAWQPVLNAVWLHGHMADQWPTESTLTASRLARSLPRLPLQTLQKQ